MSQPQKLWVEKSAAPAYPARFCSTTEGRGTLPDILQDTYRKKSITGFMRYGRVLAAIIPLEAVLLLAGESDKVDESMKTCIRNAALNLLRESPAA